MTISGAQVREARELLGWTRNRLGGERWSTARRLSSIKCALEDFGVIFTPENGDGPGVRFRKVGKG